MEVEEITIKAEPMEFDEDDVEQWIEQTVMQKAEMDGSDFGIQPNTVIKDENECDALTSFRVVEEQSNIITVNAADLKSEDERVFVERLNKRKKHLELNMPGQQQGQRFLLQQQQQQKGAPKSNGNFMATCPKCRQNFHSFRTYTKHLEPGQCTIAANERPCPMCLLTFSEQHEMDAHVRRHRENRFFCKIHCGAYFNTLVECEEHEMREHLVRNMKCYICMHKFRAYSFLMEHRQLHRTLAHVVCSFCREWFTTQAMLQEHWEKTPAACGRLLCAGMESAEPNLEVQTRNKTTAVKRSAVAPTGATRSTTATTEKKRSRKQQHVQRKIEDEEEPPVASATTAGSVIAVAIKEEPEEEPAPPPHVPVDVIIKTEPTDDEDTQDPEMKSSLAIGERIFNNLKLRGIPNLKVIRLPLTSRATNSLINTTATALPPPPLASLPSSTVNTAAPPKMSELTMRGMNFRGVQIVKLPPNTNIVRLNGMPNSGAPNNNNTNTNITSRRPPNATVTLNGAEKRPVVIQVRRVPARPAMPTLTPAPKLMPITAAMQQQYTPPPMTLMTPQTIGQSLLKPVRLLPMLPRTTASPTTAVTMTVTTTASATLADALTAIAAIKTERPATPPAAAAPADCPSSTAPTAPMHTILKMNAFEGMDSTTMSQHDFQKLVVETIANNCQKNSCTTGERKLCFVPKGILSTIERLPEKQQLIKNMLQQIKQATKAGKCETNAAAGGMTLGSASVAFNGTLEMTNKPNIVLPTHNTQLQMAAVKPTLIGHTAPLSVAALPLSTVLGMAEVETQTQGKISPTSLLKATQATTTPSLATNTLMTSAATSPPSETENAAAGGATTTGRRSSASSSTGGTAVRTKHACPNCDRCLSTKLMLNDHMRANCSRVRLYQCLECPKRFFSGNTLRTHMSIHTGELPYKCNSCDARFRTRGQVNVHNRRHTGERPFVCQVCSQSFTHRETLISHLSRHIGMKRYKCYACDMRFSCVSGLKMHRENRPDTCGKVKLNSRAIGPRVRVVRGNVFFEPQPEINPYLRTQDPDEVLSEIQNVNNNDNSGGSSNNNNNNISLSSLMNNAGSVGGGLSHEHAAIMSAAGKGTDTGGLLLAAGNDENKTN